MKTSVSYTRFAVLAYPWVSMYPELDDKPLPEPVDITLGIKSLQFSRSKASTSNVLSFRIVGPVSWAIRPGTWIVLRSSILPEISEDSLVPIMEVEIPGGATVKTLPQLASLKKAGTISATKGMPRFIGQVSSVQTEYSADEEGRLHRSTTVQVREWSDILSISVRYDDMALARLLDTSNPGTAAAVAGQLAKVTDHVQLSATLYNAFQFAQMILRTIGAINANQQDNPILKALGYNYPEVAATMPNIPSPLLRDLGLATNTGASNEVTNISSFINLVFGVQKAPIESGKFFTSRKGWPGIFPGNIADQVSMSGPTNPFFDRDPPQRPVSRGKFPLLYSGAPAWNLITESTDPSINEAFTDFIYTYTHGADGSVEVGARPTIFLRDKPFLLRNYEEKSPEALGGKDVWSHYDDLPRITLSSVYIKSMAISNTFIGVPNFLRVNYVSQDFDAVAVQYQQVAANKSPLFFRPEARRFGGVEQSIETTYITHDLIGFSEKSLTDAKPTGIAFFKKMNEVLKLWYMHSYKFGHGSLLLKDPGIPLTVGFNLQWKMGGKWLVGHIESFSTSATIDEEGKHTATTRVELSRVMECASEGADLTFIPIHEMFNLIGQAPELPPADYYKSSDPTQSLNESLGNGAPGGPLGPDTDASKSEAFAVNNLNSAKA